jgi:hypothetical protein
MASSDERATPDNAADFTPVAKPIERPRTPPIHRDDGSNLPLTPSRAVVKRAPTAGTPRLKKKLPWKGKNVMVLLPRDEERGQPGKSPIPLTEANVSGMLRSWQQLGYNIDGFDLYEPAAELNPREQSQSRGAWPDPDDIARERKAGGWRVLLPDLNGTHLWPDWLWH